MAGLCFYGTASIDQYGIQSVQGTLFILISENTFTNMYSALTIFPKRDPLFMRERQAGLYNIFQYYLTSVIALVRAHQSIHPFDSLLILNVIFVFLTDSWINR